MITPLAEALAERGYDALTPVQEAVTAAGMGEADLLVSAQTGSGKTVGFGLAIAPTLLAGAERFGAAGLPLALVIAPTRELAMQVMAELRWLYAKTGAQVASCVGGMDIRQERRALERGAHIVVGTPGRLSDHIRRGSLALGGVRAVVLDEADEMLDLGFREDLEFILGEAPIGRRTLMFSATVSPTIAKLAQEFQRDALRINTIAAATAHADIAYRALRVAPSDVDNAIFNLLRFHHDEAAIVFANTRATVNHLAARLANRGLPVVSLSGELSQSERTHALQAMRDGRARVCIATDVAARGIDLPKLALVIHAELPTNTESLLHRSGRTGRAGRKGTSVLVVPPKMAKRAERLLREARLAAEWGVPPSADEIVRRDEERLLTDPAWREPIDEEQAAFAGRLLERHGSEAVAAAFLRLHLARHAAPEDLLPPEAAAPSERREFGPSRWFVLSVGRAAGAEPRWILPTLRRLADLEKEAIGAIRVRQDATFVEIAEASVGQFEAALGPDGAVKDGVTARRLDGVPDFVARPRAPQEREAVDWRDRKAPKPHRKGGRWSAEAASAEAAQAVAQRRGVEAQAGEAKEAQPERGEADAAPRPEGKAKTPHRKGARWQPDGAPVMPAVAASPRAERKRVEAEPAPRAEGKVKKPHRKGTKWAPDAPAAERTEGAVTPYRKEARAAGPGKAAKTAGPGKATKAVRKGKPGAVAKGKPGKAPGRGGDQPPRRRG